MRRPADAATEGRALSGPRDASARFDGRVLVVGFGSIAQAVLPLLSKRWGWSGERVRVLAPECDARLPAVESGIVRDARRLTEHNFGAVLGPLLRRGDLLVNLSVDVSSLDLIRWCRGHGVLYVDTGIEPWPGGYDAADAATTNYALRRAVLALHEPGAPTAVVAHGANPGLVSHFAKQGLLELAALKGVRVAPPHDWAALACALGVKVIQIAERDTQVAREPVPPGGFHNTWSVDGLIAESWQCAELGWGTHEPRLPPDGRRHAAGDGCGIYLTGHAAQVKVKTWVPSCGETDAYLITHNEALSLAAFLTIPGADPARPRYRPTVYFAYDPSPATRASLDAWVAGGFREPGRKRVLRDSLVQGSDELGVLFVFDGGAYWYGSTLALAEARALAPRNSATTLQVAAGVLGAIDWLFAHPCEGVVEAEAMDHAHVLAVARPYLGTMSGVPADWQPGAKGDLSFAGFRLAPTATEVGLEAL